MSDQIPDRTYAPSVPALVLIVSSDGVRFEVIVLTAQRAAESTTERNRSGRKQLHVLLSLAQTAP